MGASAHASVYRNHLRYPTSLRRAALKQKGPKRAVLILERFILAAFFPLTVHLLYDMIGEPGEKLNNT